MQPLLSSCCEVCRDEAPVGQAGGVGKVREGGSGARVRAVALGGMDGAWTPGGPGARGKGGVEIRRFREQLLSVCHGAPLGSRASKSSGAKRWASSAWREYHGGVSGKRDGLGAVSCLTNSTIHPSGPGPAPVLPPSPGECGTGCGVSLKLR